MPIHKAKQAAQENLKLIDLKKDPVTYNMNVALFNLAEAIQLVLARLDDVERRVLGAGR
jgi:hypothetical protein